MKKLFKKIRENKFQFIFFACLVGLLIFTFVIRANSKTDKPTDNPNNEVETPKEEDPIVEVTPEEVIQLPFDDSIEYKVVRKFYEKDGTKEDQKLSLIKYQNSYRTSTGTSYARNDDSNFDVLSVLSGKVIEIKQSPLYGNYVVLEHKDGFTTYYYGLSEVTVTLGNTVNQGDKLGVSGKTEIDAETGNHVYVKMVKSGTCYNPEKLIGKKISEIK